MKFTENNGPNSLFSVQIFLGLGLALGLILGLMLGLRLGLGLFSQKLYRPLIFREFSRNITPCDSGDVFNWTQAQRRQYAFNLRS